MLPKFSIAASRFTITFLSAIRRAPWERLMLMIAGSSCGVSPTASASAEEQRIEHRLVEVDVESKDRDDEH